MNFPKTITKWYKLNARDLPWRETNDPYKIWMSEIILQQTRVDQGLSYYLKFLDHYTDIHAFAAADEDEVLKLWQGLGYYSRARNMHFTAKQIANEMNGQFPSTAKELQKLKGVGPYTAAAIASFAYGEVAPVIDGNVSRVLSRAFGMDDAIDSKEGAKRLQVLADEAIDHDDPATYNQAIMEFGALQCTPKNPDCNNCPLRDGCYALSHGMVDALPFKAKKTKVTDRWFDYFIFEHKGHTWLNKRTGRGIWQNLYDFPCIEHESPLPEEQLFVHPQLKEWVPGERFQIKSVSKEFKHILSHQRLHVRFLEVELNAAPAGLSSYIKTHRKDLEKFAIPKLVDRYLNHEK